MPRLRRYVRGTGCYIAGHVPGVGYSTWQIGAEGLDYLAALGIARDGDRILPHDLRGLLERELIWTLGEGPGGVGSPSPEPALDRLAIVLEDWAGGGGGLRRLAEVIRIDDANYLDRCFSAAMIDWLEQVAPDGSLSEFVGLTESAFADLAAKRHSELSADPLFGRYAASGTHVVLWRLAANVGLVARQLRGGRELPAAWRDEPVLRYIFARLSGRDRPPGPTARPRAAPRRPPFVSWDVELQQVVAVLPAHPLPDGVTGLSWQVNGGEPVLPLVRSDGAMRVAEESDSGPLKPSEVYQVRVAYPGDATRASGRWGVTMTTGLVPLVLFQPDGTLFDLGRPEPLVPGEYLALVEPGAEATVRGRRGLDLVERLPLAPVGWPRWTGWRLRIEPGADIDPYPLVEPGRSATWELESPHEPPVTWLDALPVWLGGLPRVLLNAPSPFIGAVLEVDAEFGGGHRAIHRDLVIGTDIPLSAGPGRPAIDLAGVPSLAGSYGRIHLTCRPPEALDGPPLVLEFVRLPELGLRYVADPDKPASALAVRLESGGLGVLPGPDTERLIDPGDPGAVVLRPVDPVTSPAVTAHLPHGRGEVRVRVPVTRTALSTAADGFLGWAAPPLEALDLGSIRPEDRLILEFHREPPTERGRLVTRVAGCGELFLGDRCDESGRAYLFEIELHRLRDGFGPQASGPVQVRGASGWIDLARLRATVFTETARNEVRPDRKEWWQEWAGELERLAASGDVAAVEVLIKKCLDRCCWTGHSEVADDLLPLAVARATLTALEGPEALARARAALEPLVDRPDLPEARALGLTLVLRSGFGTAGDGRWTLDDLEALGAEVPRGVDRDLLLAEGWYRYASFADGPGLACWDSCLDLCEQLLRRPAGVTRQSISDAVLLREMARLMRYDFHSEPDVPWEDVLPSRLPWVGVARFVNRYVREPRPRPRAYPDVPVLPAGRPSVLRPEDAELLRSLVDHARGASIDDRAWSCWGVAPFTGLLRARGALYAGFSSVAREEYDKFLKHALADELSELLDLIAEERPLA